MSVARTPPKELSGSAPNLANIHIFSTDSNISSKATVRHEKRKREDVFEEELVTFMTEMRNMLASVTETQNQKFSLIQTTMQEIKNQNNEITKAMDFLSAKYDEIKTKLENSEKERTNCLIYIKSLENRIDQLERSTRNTSIEIRNVPKNDVENKDQLVGILKNIGTALKTEIVDSDIKDVYRYKSKSFAKMPIIVDFTTVAKKEAILNSVKQFKQQSKAKLSTTHANIPGPAEAIFISESLSTQNKKLFAMARKFAQENAYKFCWTIRGTVYLRKDEGLTAVRLTNEDDFKKLASIK